MLQCPAGRRCWAHSPFVHRATPTPCPLALPLHAVRKNVLPLPEDRGSLQMHFKDLHLKHLASNGGRVKLRDQRESPAWDLGSEVSCLETGLSQPPRGQWTNSCTSFLGPWLASGMLSSEVASAPRVSSARQPLLGKTEGGPRGPP